MGWFKRAIKAVAKVASTVASVAKYVSPVGYVVGTAIQKQTQKILQSDRTGGTQGDSTFNSQPLPPIPPKVWTIEAPPAPLPSPQPIPDPVQPLPPEELQGDPLTTPGRVKLEQNPERYKTVSGNWQIQAEPQIAPLTLVSGVRPDLKPLLRANGIVVKVGDEYLCSKRTLADILNSGNPHYDVAENGRVLNTPMGRSVPIITIDISKLNDMAARRDGVNIYAGVKSVDYTSESEPEPGTKIPKGLIRQINATLVDAIEREPDVYEVWDLPASMQGNYAITSLVTTTSQEENKLDWEKLSVFLTGLDDRLKRIRGDFNMIKDMFYNGTPPTGTIPTLKYQKMAKTVDEDDEKAKNKRIFKRSEMVSTQPTPVTNAPAPPAESPAVTGERALSGGLRGLLKDAKTRLNPQDQRNALIAKWQGYKWTDKEAEYLKTVAVQEVEKPPKKAIELIPRRGGEVPKWNWNGYTFEDGTIVGTDRVRWTSDMETKARIRVPLPTRWGSPISPNTPNPVLDPRTETRLIELFGKPPGYDDQRRKTAGSTSTTLNSSQDNNNEFWWINQNVKRQAEIVKLAYDIRAIELETGKKIPAIQPPGVTIGGQPATSTGNLFGGKVGGVRP